jgi:adenylate cyclase
MSFAEIRVVVVEPGSPGRGIVPSVRGTVMGVEIERRFRVDPNKLPRRLPPGKRLVQGFLSLEPVVRIRITRGAARGSRKRERAYLTIKGRGLRIRPEFEYDVPLDDARELLKLCGDWKIEKVRTQIGPWELDRYTGRFKGLWLAEIELERARTPLPDPLPAWVLEEVTNDLRYTNAHLVRAGRIPE